MTKKKFKVNFDTIGDYNLLKRLGVGGNGVVYLVESKKDNKQYAMKILMKFAHDVSYGRFKNEIQALTDTAHIENIVDIIDFNLPDQPTEDNTPFYIMPLAKPYEDYIKDKSHEVLFKDFIKISQALTKLHSLDLTHRDIKPNNILVIDTEPQLSDFGLVKFPKKSTLSGRNEVIGPMWTIAPEMQRESSTAEFKATDVYSLAKTLWIMVTRVEKGFEGQYIANSVISIDKFVEVKVNQMTNAGDWHYFSIRLLDDLLSEATNNDPKQRPTAQEFHDVLELWLKLNDDFDLRNYYEWNQILDGLFPFGVPETSTWSGKPAIFQILKNLTSYDNLNYCFLPGHGGESMTDIEFDEQSGYFIMNNTNLFKTKQLIFRTLAESEWSYFRIVLEELEPTIDITTTPEEKEFNRTMLGMNNDIMEDTFEYNTVEMDRYFRGSFIIIQRTSPINSLRGSHKGYFMDGHTGSHDKLSYEDYHEGISIQFDSRSKKVQK